MPQTTHFWTPRRSKGPLTVHNDASFRTLRASQTAPPEQRAKDIRALLEQLGPQYSLFALYLSSRIDLLPAAYCREFALTPDRSLPLAGETAEELLREQLGADLNKIFLEFRSDPLRSMLTSQSHFARLKAGTSVVVRLLRPEYHSLHIGSGHLKSFDVGLLRSCCAEVAADTAVDDFFLSLRRKTDFTLQAEIVHRMDADAASLDLLGSYKVYGELCRQGVLVLDYADDRSLGQFRQLFPDRADVSALRLCEVWLHQAFFGKCYPVDPQECNVLIRNNGQICFSECDFTTLPKTAKENLWSYLMAVAKDEPDVAALHLLSEMYRLPHARVDPEAFRSSFRQAAAFGELEPILGTNSNSLSQLVFQHWKTALEHGYHPQPHLLSLLRGLFSIARIAGTMSPLRDPLRDGLEEVHAAKTLQRFLDLAEWRSMLRESDKFATALAQFPQVLDDVLSKTAQPGEEDLLLKHSAQEPAWPRGSLGSLAVVFLLAMAVFISQSSHEASHWAPGLAGLTLMLAGLLVLKRLMG